MPPFRRIAIVAIRLSAMAVAALRQGDSCFMQEWSSGGRKWLVDNVILWAMRCGYSLLG